MLAAGARAVTCSNRALVSSIFLSCCLVGSEIFFATHRADHDTSWCGVGYAELSIIPFWCARVDHYGISLGDWRAKRTNSSVLAHTHFWSADSLPLGGGRAGWACNCSSLPRICGQLHFSFTWPWILVKCVLPLWQRTLEIAGYLCHQVPGSQSWHRLQCALCGFNLCLWAPTFPWFPPFYVHLPFLPAQDFMLESFIKCDYFEFRPLKLRLLILAWILVHLSSILDFPSEALLSLKSY